MPFKPGQSGNPGGRPKSMVEVVDLAREFTAPILRRFAKIALESENETAAVRAGEIVLERGWGKAPQTITIDDKAPDTSLEDVELDGRIDILARKALRDRRRELGEPLAQEMSPKSSSVVH